MSIEVTLHRCVCIKCYGHGYLPDAVFTYNAEKGEHEYRPGSRCYVCRGKGVVNLSPVEDDKD